MLLLRLFNLSWREFCTYHREFEYEKTMKLWEVLWTHYLSEHLHLYVCVAILKRYRNKIMGEQMDFDTLLKFINELSGQIDLDATLRDAEALCICAGENGAANIPPGTPPSLPIDSGLLCPQQDDILWTWSLPLGKDLSILCHQVLRQHFPAFCKWEDFISFIFQMWRAAVAALPKFSFFLFSLRMKLSRNPCLSLHQMVLYGKRKTIDSGAGLCYLPPFNPYCPSAK